MITCCSGYSLDVIIYFIVGVGLNYIMSFLEDVLTRLVCLCSNSAFDTAYQSWNTCIILLMSLI